MDYPTVRAYAEEVELWTTLTINASIIFGGIPTAIAYFRRVPRERLPVIAVYGAVFGALVVIVAFGFVMWAHETPRQKLQTLYPCVWTQEQKDHHQMPACMFDSPINREF